MAEAEYEYECCRCQRVEYFNRPHEGRKCSCGGTMIRQ